jgi:hypothetical protein
VWIQHSKSGCQRAWFVISCDAALRSLLTGWLIVPQCMSGGVEDGVGWCRTHAVIDSTHTTALPEPFTCPMWAQFAQRASCSAEAVVSRARTFMYCRLLQLLVFTSTLGLWKGVVKRLCS